MSFVDALLRFFYVAIRMAAVQMISYHIMWLTENENKENKGRERKVKEEEKESD